MRTSRFSRCFLIPAALVLTVVAGSAVATDRILSVAQTISANALLKDIHRRDPQQAFELALEAQETLAAAERSDADAQKPAFRLRDGQEASPQASPEDQESRQKNSEDFDNNPILRDIYGRSPVASLRLLKRLREAATKNN